MRPSHRRRALSPVYGRRWRENAVGGAGFGEDQIGIGVRRGRTLLRARRNGGDEMDEMFHRLSRQRGVAAKIGDETGNVDHDIEIENPAVISVSKMPPAPVPVSRSSTTVK